MARKPATLGLSSNIELRAAAPLDGRQKVETLADLTAPESFPYHFVGMETYCVESQKWYTLRYDDPTDINNWVVNGTGADGKNGFSVEVQSVEKQGRENIVTFVWKNPEGADSYQDMSVLDGAAGPEGPRGPEGPAGADGQSFTISSQYASYEAMIADHPTGSAGEAYFVENDETGVPDVYVWLVEDAEWSNIGSVQGGRGPQGPVGPAGFSPDITVAETTDSSYKLRVTNQSGSYLTPNLKGNLAPIDTIDPASAVPVQSKAIAAALDTKQPKILATPVGVRDYATENIVNQTTVQTTLEALAAAVNYMNIPAQLTQKVATEEELPANAKPGSICFVGEEGDTPVVYICQDDGEWQKAGGASDDVMVEFTDNEIHNIWEEAPEEITPIVKFWQNKVWNGLDGIDFIPMYIWSDGNNIYYSRKTQSQNIQKVLNKNTSTWEDVTWNGFNEINGTDVWTDGEKIYYSYYSGAQYVLNKETSTWESKTWNSFNNIHGANVWEYDGDYYYSENTEQKKLNKENSRWDNKTWNLKSKLKSGGYVWTDGDNTYYSQNTSGTYTHLVMNKETSEWENKSWGSFINFNGMNVWNDNNKVYCSVSSNQKVLDKVNSVWENTIWDGMSSFNGEYIWTDGDNIYYSNGSTHKVLT